MREKMQQMLERIKLTRNGSGSRAVEQRSDNTPAESVKEDWDMSPQDALQVGIVARYK